MGNNYILGLVFRYLITICGLIFLKSISNLDNKEILYYFVLIAPLLNLNTIIDNGNKNHIISGGNKPIDIYLLNNVFILGFLLIIFQFILPFNKNIDSTIIVIYLLFQLAFYPLELRTSLEGYHGNTALIQKLILLIQIFIISIFYLLYNLPVTKEIFLNKNFLICISIIWVIIPSALPILLIKNKLPINFKFIFNIDEFKLGFKSSALYLVGYFSVGYIPFLIFNKNELISFGLTTRIVSISAVATIFIQLFIAKIKLRQFGIRWILIYLGVALLQGILVSSSVFLLSMYIFKEIKFDSELGLILFILGSVLGLAAVKNVFLIRQKLMNFYLASDLLGLSLVLLFRGFFEISSKTGLIQIIVFEIVGLFCFGLYISKNSLYGKK